MPSDLLLDSRVTLNDGNAMPVFGLGVWRTPPGAVTRDSVRYALDVGYRLIDTAKMYGNEADVGEAVRASGVPRDEVFVTTKLWNDDHGHDTALQAFDRSSRLLGLGTVDLYLIHWPVPKLRGDTWRALGRLQKEGRVRSIGVSNYTIPHLEELLRESDVVPAVNQVELSPFLAQKDLVAFCGRHRIAVEAYSPLTKGHRLDEPRLAAIAKRYGRTPAQVLIRWGLQHGLIEIPKSQRRERILENSRVFDFTISEADLRAMDGFDLASHVAWDPTGAP